MGGQLVHRLAVWAIHVNPESFENLSCEYWTKMFFKCLPSMEVTTHPIPSLQILIFSFLTLKDHLNRKKPKGRKEKRKDRAVWVKLA